MSLDLSLVPLTDMMETLLSVDNTIQPRTILAFKTNFYNIFSQFRDLSDYSDEISTPVINPHQFPDKVFLVMEGTREMKDSYWGEPFPFVFAKELQGVDMGDDSQHKAIKAYVDALPPETRILLCWS